MGDTRTGGLEWFISKRRTIIPLDDFNVSRSLRQAVRHNVFEIRADTAFRDVITACAEPAPGREETWITQTIIELYCVLHEAGIAHCIEAWIDASEVCSNEDAGDVRDGKVLVGGLYGIHMGGLFAGESMFSRPALGGSNASKVCLVHLVAHLRRQGFDLLDAQLPNPHLKQFGCEEMSASAYQARLEEIADLPTEWGTFDSAETKSQFGWA